MFKIFLRISGKYIEYAETKFMKKTNKTNSEDRCVLENLLYVDSQTAHIMALETLMNIEMVNTSILIQHLCIIKTILIIYFVTHHILIINYIFYKQNYFF